MTDFNEHNPAMVLLLVSKRLNTIAKAVPQLRSKVGLKMVQSPLSCFGLKKHTFVNRFKQFSFVLSLVKSVPLDIELVSNRRLHPQSRVVSPNLGIGSNLTTSSSDTDCDWPDEALRLFGTDRRSRR